MREEIIRMTRFSQHILFKQRVESNEQRAKNNVTRKTYMHLINDKLKKLLLKVTRTITFNMSIA